MSLEDPSWNSCADFCFPLFVSFLKFQSFLNTSLLLRLRVSFLRARRSFDIAQTRAAVVKEKGMYQGKGKKGGKREGRREGGGEGRKGGREQEVRKEKSKESLGNGEKGGKVGEEEREDG